MATRPVRGNGLYAHVVGWGVEVPEQVMTNHDIEQLVDTSDKWIRERTGIAERRVAGERENVVTLGIKAARKALNHADILPADIDLIIVATSSSKFIFPATACIIQDKLGSTQAGAFDIQAACSGFIYGLGLASAQIKTGVIETALVIGTEVLSRIVNWEDRSTCILFGDGAGAFVLQARDIPGGVGEVVMHSDGSGGKVLYANSGVRDTWNGNNGTQTSTYMNGREVFRFASRVMVSATQEVVEESGLTLDDIAMVIPHQANLRIIQSAARGLKLPMDKFAINIDKYGNTSAASIPLALDEAVRDGKIKPNDKLVLVGFGGGLTWGAAVIHWEVEPTPGSYIREAFREVWYIFASVRSFFRRMLRYIEALFVRHNDKQTGEQKISPPDDPTSSGE